MESIIGLRVSGSMTKDFVKNICIVGKVVRSENGKVIIKCSDRTEVFVATSNEVHIFLIKIIY